MKTKVVHSQKNNAWKIIGLRPGGIYNYARVNYPVYNDKEGINAIEKAEAYKRANKISLMFNMEEEG